MESHNSITGLHYDYPRYIMELYNYKFYSCVCVGGGGGEVDT